LGKENGAVENDGRVKRKLLRFQGCGAPLEDETAGGNPCGNLVAC